MSTHYPDGAKLPEARDKSQEGGQQSESLRTTDYQVAIALEGALGREDQLLAQLYQALEEKKSDDAKQAREKKAEASIEELKKRFPPLEKLLTDQVRYRAQADIAAQVALKSAEFSASEWVFMLKYKLVLILQYVTIISLFVICLIWPAWQWGQRRSRKEGVERRLGKKAKIKAKPNPIRRALAVVADLCIAVVLGLLVGVFGGMISQTIVTLVSGNSDDMAGFYVFVVVFVCTLIAYLLFRDAIKYRFHRSIGKLIFQLRPVMITPEHRAITLKVSAKRNWILVPFFATPLIVLFADITDFDYDVLDQDIYEVPEIYVVMGILMVLFLFVDFTLAAIKEGRTLQDRLAKTKVIDIRSEEPMAIDSGRRQRPTVRQ